MRLMLPVLVALVAHDVVAQELPRVYLVYQKTNPSCRFWKPPNEHSATAPTGDCAMHVRTTVHTELRRKEMAAAKLAVMVAVLAILSCTPILAQIPGLRVFVANGVTGLVQDLRQEAEQATRLPLLIQTGEAALLVKSLENGAPFDVAILSDWAVDELVKSGKAIGTTRLTLARAAIGLCVRMGAAKPKIDTIDSFKEAMLKADSVAVTAATNPGSARHALEQAFERLGIANVMKPKTILTPVNQATQWVADAKAQFAINYVSNILSAPGVDLVGAIPEELQRYIDFDVVSATTSRDSQAVRELLKFLGEPHDQQLRAHGNEPPRRTPQR